MKKQPDRYELVIMKDSKPNFTYTNQTVHSIRELLSKSHGYSTDKMVLGDLRRLINVQITKEQPVVGKLLEPTDTWQPQRRHMKQLFEGYIRAKYSFMEDWQAMYNTGLSILLDAGQPAYLRYIENFMEMMRKKYYPDRPVETIHQPRFFKVTLDMQVDGNAKITEDTMTFSEVCNLWPNITAIIEHPQFKKVNLLTTEADLLTIVKLENNEMSLRQGDV